jgi:hypothetical protein
MEIATTAGRTAIGVVAVLVFSAPVWGQTFPPPAARDQPRWDAGGGFGLLWVRDADVGDDGDGALGSYQLRFDAGRYLTPHLKLGLHVASGPRFRTAAIDYVEANGRSFPTLVGTHTRLITLAPGVTYQFGDNQFLHPYITGGAQIDLLDLHRKRNPETVRAPVPVSLIDERKTAVNARPFAAAGFKAYFSRRVFVRPEVLAGFGPGGIRQFTLHLGGGVDF